MKPNQVYITIPRKAIVAILSAFICLLIGVVSSFQYADYIDRRSNQRWCGVVRLFNTAYVENPPPSTLGKEIASAMVNLEKEFSCKGV